MTIQSISGKPRPGTASPARSRTGNSRVDHPLALPLRTRRLSRDGRPRRFGVETSRTPKLDVLVNVDVDGSTIRLIIRGKVTGHNLTAVFVLVKRANAVATELTIIVDVRDAVIETGPLERLRAASSEGTLPSDVDPFDTPCRLLVLEPQTY